MDDSDRARVGEEYEMEPVPIDEEAIRRFARAVGETNPLFLDPEAAREGTHGGLIASPTFFLVCYPPKKYWGRRFPEPGYFLGGLSCDFFRPIRPGDVLSGRGKITDVYEKTGRGGKMLFTVHQLLYTNQRGEKVAEVQMSWVKQLEAGGEAR